MFDPVDCVYMANGVGVLCRPSLVFRRVMVNGHQPPALTFRDLLVTSVPANRTSRVFFTNYNEMGYQFTTPTRQEVWLHWDTPVDIPIERLAMHKIDPLNATIGWLPVSMRFVQVSGGQQEEGVAVARGDVRVYCCCPPHSAMSAHVLACIARLQK
jgi:hypothetical protein